MSFGPATAVHPKLRWHLVMILPTVGLRSPPLEISSSRIGRSFGARYRVVESGSLRRISAQRTSEAELQTRQRDESPLD